MGQVDGKVCIVTGAAGSIGLATVRVLLQEGAKVALVDIDEGKLGRAAASLDPDQVITIAADVAKTDEVKAYVARTVATWGKIDVLFSNAGNDGPISPRQSIRKRSSFDHRHPRARLLSRLQIRHSADERQRQHRHHVEHHRREGRGGNCSYVAAKHALMGLMRCIAKEVAKHGIRVNTINPGPIDNEFMRTAERHMSGLLGRDAGDFFDQMIPLGRHGKPEEIARAVLFLASDHSAYTSGSALMLDGGLCA